MSQRRDNSIHPRSCIRQPAWKVAAAAAASMFLLTTTHARSQPVPGTLDVHWNEGASDCSATPQVALQVHTYEPRTFILRVLARPSKQIFFIFSSAPTKLF